MSPGSNSRFALWFKQRIYTIYLTTASTHTSLFPSENRKCEISCLLSICLNMSHQDNSITETTAFINLCSYNYSFIIHFNRGLLLCEFPKKPTTLRRVVQITARFGRPTAQLMRQYTTPTARWITETKLQSAVQKFHVSCSPSTKTESNISRLS